MAGVFSRKQEPVRCLVFIHGLWPGEEEEGGRRKAAWLVLPHSEPAVSCGLVDAAQTSYFTDLHRIKLLLLRRRVYN